MFEPTGLPVVHKIMLIGLEYTTTWQTNRKNTHKFINCWLSIKGASENSPYFWVWDWYAKLLGAPWLITALKTICFRSLYDYLNKYSQPLHSENKTQPGHWLLRPTQAFPMVLCIFWSNLLPIKASFLLICIWHRDFLSWGEVHPRAAQRPSEGVINAAGLYSYPWWGTPPHSI